MIKKGLIEFGFCRFFIKFFVGYFLRFCIKNFILLKHTHNLKLFDKITDSTMVKNILKYQ